jgi:transposase
LAAIQAGGAQLLSLPPYSPDFSPIEPCWSKTQDLSARSQNPPREALEAALDTITAADACGWFRHCGSA